MVMDEFRRVSVPMVSAKTDDKPPMEQFAYLCRGIGLLHRRRHYVDFVYCRCITGIYSNVPMVMISRSSWMMSKPKPPLD